MDWNAALYDPIYASLGTIAELDLGSDGTVALTVIDKGRQASMFDPTMQTTLPCVDVRRKELAENGVDLTFLKRAQITFNGKQWTISHFEYRPGPQGEASGEVRLVLVDDV